MTVAGPEARRTQGRRRSRWRRTGLYAAVVVISAWSILPFLWMMIAAFQPDLVLSRRVPSFFPSPATLTHWRNVFIVKQFGSYILNSVIVASTATVITLIIAAMCAYGLARLPLPGKGLILAVILGLSMFPQIAIVAPLYLVMNQLHLLDTYPGLAGSYVGLGVPLMVYVLWGHFRAIPYEIDEAARVDGAGPVRTLFSIIVPMAMPAMVTAGLLGFILNWGEFLLALSFTTSPAHQTIPVGIANFTALYFVPWGDQAAASVAVTIPLVILVLVFQRRIVSGLTAGAVNQ